MIRGALFSGNSNFSVIWDISQTRSTVNMSRTLYICLNSSLTTEEYPETFMVNLGNHTPYKF